MYLYLAVCPSTGKGFAAFLATLTGAFFHWFLKQINGDLARPTLVVADGRTEHKAERFDDNILAFSKLVPACPELNPVKRVFLAVRRGLKHRVFRSLERAQQCVRRVVEDLFSSAGTMVSLPCFPYIAAALPPTQKTTLQV